LLFHVSVISILIVEDHDDFRLRLQALLASDPDFHCAAAADASSAYRRLESEVFDVVIMDINLPGTSGIELTQRVKERWPNVQVLICTVHEDEDKIFNALKAGATGYILKRAPLTELTEAVRQIHQGESPMTGSIARKVVSSFGIKPLQNGERLTEREQAVLDLLAEGLKAKEIADKLFVSITTVRSHVRHIYEKLQVQNRVEMLKRTGHAR
jgi:DNA-binding NarL/FixJ family response regulator